MSEPTPLTNYTTAQALGALHRELIADGLSASLAEAIVTYAFRDNCDYVVRIADIVGGEVQIAEQGEGAARESSSPKRHEAQAVDKCEFFHKPMNMVWPEGRPAGMMPADIREALNEYGSILARKIAERIDRESGPASDE